MNIFQCVCYVYQIEGICGFYRGLIVFYVGIFEIIICFVIYESLKKYLKEVLLVFFVNGIEKNFISFFGFMVVVVFFKGCVFCIVYLYEVIRIRFWEEGIKYKFFVQMVCLVFWEEGYFVFYRGFFVQFIWQILNIVIVLFIYELIVYLLEDCIQ